MPNLLEQAIDVIEKHQHYAGEVQWVGSEEWGWFSWEEFAEIEVLDYDDPRLVAGDLIIKGNGWWLAWQCRGAVGGWRMYDLPTMLGEEAHNVPDHLTASLPRQDGWTIAALNVEEDG